MNKKGFLGKNMAVSLNLKNIDKETKSKIIKNLRITPKKTQFNTNPSPIYMFCVNNVEDKIYFPMGVYKDYFDTFPIYGKIYPTINISPSFELLTVDTDPLKRKRDQNIVVKEALGKLKENHTVFLSCFTGYGKTRSAIYILCKLGHKAIVLCHSDIIKEQWKDELLKWCPGIKIQIITGNKPIDKQADVYIVGILKAKSLKRDEVSHIGTVIIDEAHICTITAFVNSLLKFQPKYLIGLSATPERSDGLQSLFTFYFGIQKNFIIREETKAFTVIKYQTRYVPEVSYQQFKGESVLAWTDMMTSLATIKERWIDVANIAIDYPTQKIILICDRVIMAENIFDYLTDKGEDAVLFIGKTKTWDKSKRILITSVKKGGVGLNDESLTMLILAADMRNVKQCEGRIRTTNNIVVDVVDDYSALENHWKIREKWYTKRGATIIYKNEEIKLDNRRFLKPLN